MMLRQITVSIPILLLALPSSAQTSFGTSMACFYAIITKDHDDAVTCGVPLDSAHEATYMAAHSALEQYIRDNASRTAKGRYDGDQLLSMFRRMSNPKPGLTKDEICEQFASRMGRKSLDTETSDETIAKLQEAIKTPGDSMAGGCI